LLATVKTIAIFVATALLLLLTHILPNVSAQQQQPPMSPEGKAFNDLLSRCLDEAGKLANGTASPSMIMTCDNGIQEGMDKYCGLQYDEQICTAGNKAMADMYYIVKDFGT
jgi:hypothetical protein